MHVIHVEFNSSQVITKFVKQTKVVHKESSIISTQKKKKLHLPTSGIGSTISQFGTDLKNMATFCMPISVA